MPIGINFTSETSAQLKSACILAALNSFGTTNIYEKVASRNHTENMMKNNKEVFKTIKNNHFKIFGKKSLKNFKIQIPNDPSSAAFFTALTLLNEKSTLKIKSIGLNPRRIGFYKILKKSGAKIYVKNKKKLTEKLLEI